MSQLGKPELVLHKLKVEAPWSELVKASDIKPPRAKLNQLSHLYGAPALYQALFRFLGHIQKNKHLCSLPYP